MAKSVVTVKKKKAQSVDSPNDMKTKQTVDKPTYDNKKIELNWDIIGISTTAITLGGAAIFFVSGWFYESKWYSFYGLEISQLSLSPVNIMMQGMSGMIIFVFIVTMSWISVKTFRAIGQLLVHRKFIADPTQHGTQDLLIASYIALLILAIFVGYSEIVMISAFGDMYQASITNLFAAGLVAVFAVVLFFSNLKYLRLSPEKIAKNILNFIKRTQVTPPIDGVQSLYGVGVVVALVVILITFMLSISIASILGQLDAIRHSRSLSGWAMPKVYLYASEELPNLADFKYKSNISEFEYGPLGIIAVDEERYYFVEYQAEIFTERPRVFSVNKNGIQLIFQSTPSFYFQIEQLRITNYTPAPTLTPISEITITPTP